MRLDTHDGAQDVQTDLKYFSHFELIFGMLVDGIYSPYTSLFYFPTPKSLQEKIVKAAHNAISGIFPRLTCQNFKII